MVAELHAIEEALLCVPAGVNVCVATDSKSSIDAITNWHAWKPNRRAKQEGRGAIERIIATLARFGADRRKVSFQHIYSHIGQKLRDAGAKNETATLHAKLQTLRDELWGPFEPWVEGNEGADRLASTGHSKPHVHEPWTVPPLGAAVTIFDQDGHVVEGNLRRKTIAFHARSWSRAMSRKPARGAVLRDAHTDRPATHKALDCSRDPAVARLGNFLHKARYGALPLKHTRHRLYWAKNTDGSSVARAPPANARTDRKRLVKWMARQQQFNDQLCHLCPGGLKETTNHVLGGECTLHLPLDLDTGNAVRDMIRTCATSNKAYVDHIPLWFPHGGDQDSPLLLSMGAFLGLASYDKLMGGLGYVPADLREALGHFGIANRGELIASITAHLAKTANSKWRRRCKDMIASETWTASELRAERLVSAGVG